MAGAREGLVVRPARPSERWLRDTVAVASEGTRPAPLPRQLGGLRTPEPAKPELLT